MDSLTDVQTDMHLKIEELSSRTFKQQKCPSLPNFANVKKMSEKNYFEGCALSRYIVKYVFPFFICKTVTSFQ